jgi:adenylate cyclase class 2
MGMRKGVLTYKEPISNEDGLKQMLEIESYVTVHSLKEIFEKLGLVPSVVYEKKRSTWSWKGALVCFDTLPFGYFIEIEGKQEVIEEIERILGLGEYTEPRSYPTLARELYGTTTNVVEARFL